MSGLSGDIASKVVETINNASLSYQEWSEGVATYVTTAAPTAEMHWLPYFEMEEMNVTNITVVPRQHTSVVKSRTHLEHEVAVDVGIQRRLKRGQKDEDTEIGWYVALADDIRSLLSHDDFDLSSGEHVSFLGINSETLLAPDHLNEMRQFTHVLTVTYRVINS
tara:strand:+ start:1965 stop:2456 length:492 start_codon:yes stop_codon:yes gene_type:complete